MFFIKAYKSHRNNLLSPISHPFIALSSPIVNRTTSANELPSKTYIRLLHDYYYLFTNNDIKITPMQRNGTLKQQIDHFSLPLFRIKSKQDARPLTHDLLSHGKAFEHDKSCRDITTFPAGHFQKYQGTGKGIEDHSF